MFKVWVKTTGDRTWCSNGVEHDTQEAAHEAGVSLFMRWFAVEKWAVVPTSAFTNGSLTDEQISAAAVEQS